MFITESGFFSHPDPDSEGKKHWIPDLGSAKLIITGGKGIKNFILIPIQTKGKTYV
jgi:hypothetical protein